MSILRKYSIGKNVILLFAAAIMLSPFYISFVYSMKTREQITFTGLRFPSEFHLENFSQAVEASNFYVVLKNSVITTVPTVILLIIICPMAAYVLARNTGKAYNIIYSLFLTALLIPYQSVMLPQYMNLKQAGLLNTYLGAVMVRAAFNISFNILLFTSFVKTVPIELEEAAMIDGAGRMKTFFRIVFPLLKSVLCTAVIINALFSWNDFTITLNILMKEEMKTIPLMLYRFFGEYNVELNLAFAAFTLSMIPILILYFLLQRYIVEGVMSGAVKG